jgi:hypothetical protein
MGDVADVVADASGEDTVVAVDVISEEVELEDVSPVPPPLPHATMVTAIRQREMIIIKRFTM